MSAASQIRVSPDRLRDHASSVRAEGTNFENVIAKMQSIINVLQEEWEGQASSKFAQQFEALKPSFNAMRDLINEMGGQLDSTANAVEQLDSDIAGKFTV